MTVILHTLGPVVLLVALGASLVYYRFAPRTFFVETNRMLFWVGLPALLFIKTSRLGGDWTAGGRILAILIAGMVGCLVVGYGVGALLKLEPPSRASFVQGAYRSNLVYFGLPIILYALGSGTGGDEKLEAMAVLAISPLIPLYNLVAVLVLTSGADSGASAGPWFWPVLRRTVTNPLILACCAGLGWSATGWALPTLADRTGRALGQMALPLALLGLGASLRFDLLRKHAVAASMASVLKVAVAPLIGLGVALLLQASGGETRIALLFLACPTAVASFVMAEQLGADRDLAAAIVVGSTMFSIVPFCAILAFPQ